MRGLGGFKEMFMDKGDELQLEDIDADVEPIEKAKKASVDYSSAIPVDHGGFSVEEGKETHL